MRSFWIYLIGTILAVIGVGYALYALGVGQLWIGIAVLVIAGIGIASGAGLAKKRGSDTTNVNVDAGDKNTGS